MMALTVIHDTGNYNTRLELSRENLDSNLNIVLSPPTSSNQTESLTISLGKDGIRELKTFLNKISDEEE